MQIASPFFAPYRQKKEDFFMSEKKVGKRLLTWVLVLVMTLSLLPLNALAGDYSAGNFVPGETTLVKGDTYTLDTDDASQLPDAPEGLRWDGPESIKGDRIICEKNEHQHDSNCYELRWFIFFYYELVCSKEEHTHSDYCYNHTYKWTLVDEKAITTSNTWRRWWPVYWTLSNSGGIDANDAIESVTAGENVAYTKGSLSSAEALAGTTATLGDAVDAGGFTITTKPGYYVKAARVVCGNYTGCGVSGDLVSTGQTENSYRNTINIRFDQNNNDLNFDHLSASKKNLPKDYPTSKPTDGKYYNELRVGWNTNTLYPYYFLIQVARDSRTYSVIYSWGDQTLSSGVPDSKTNLKRNESYEVLRPSDEAIAEAAEKNLAFAGWKYNDSDRIYQVGESFPVSENVVLTAQWTQLYTVSYDLAEGSWKDGETVETAKYPENAPVSVTNNKPERGGYEFIDWTPFTDNNNVAAPVISNGKFTMPAANVVLTAQWRKIEAPELSVTKTVTKVGKTTVAAGNNTIPTAYPGDEIEWTITVTNSGNAAGDFTLNETLSDITVKDAAGNAVPLNNNEWRGTVPANDSVIYTVTYTVQPADVTDNGLVNTVTMNGTSENSEPVPTAQKHTVTGTIDNGGTVTNSSQEVPNGEASMAMTFTPADGYKITSVTVNSTAVSDPTLNSDGSYTYPAMDSVTGNIAVIVKTDKRSDLSYTVKYVDKNTGSEIHQSVVKRDKTFGDEVTGESEKVSIANYTYVEAKPDPLTIGTDVNKNVITLYYTKDAPTPGTFDFNDVVYGDGKVTPAITKTVKGNVGKNFTEAFYVTVKGADEKSTATMSATSYTGEAEVIASKSLKDVPFLFKPEAMAKAVVPYGKLRFTEAGTYTYTVREEIPGKTSRMSYDTTEYTLTIKVVLDENANTYQVESWQFTAGNREYPTPLNIVNTYRTYHPSTPSKPTLNTGDHYAYVMGYPDGTVRPNGSITRAEVSAILFRLLSDKTRDEYFTTESSFTDVKAGAWYNNSIATLEKAGVIVDTAKGGAFRPNEAITRAELAAMLAQFSDAKPVKGVKFSDVPAEHWAYEAIAIAAKMGWIEGYPDGTFRPDATITRAEMMTLVNRALERVPSDEDHLLSKRVMLTFPDCKSGDWFYIAVQEATNSHTYERAATEKNGDEQWTALRANRDWTQLEK